MERRDAVTSGDGRIDTDPDLLLRRRLVLGGADFETVEEESAAVLPVDRQPDAVVGEKGAKKVPVKKRKRKR